LGFKKLAPEINVQQSRLGMRLLNSTLSKKGPNIGQFLATFKQPRKAGFLGHLSLPLFGEWQPVAAGIKR
jgi:hypothetical protein